MNGKGRGKAKSRDLISAPQIRPAPGNLPTGNLPKSKKVTETKPKPKPKTKQGKTGNRSKDVQHD